MPSSPGLVSKGGITTQFYHCVALTTILAVPLGIPVKDLKEINRQKFTGEAKVLRMRFGIEMNTDHTLEEVAKQFDVTRERIRQIEAKALRKLRHPSRSERLRSFLDNN